MPTSTARGQFPYPEGPDNWKQLRSYLRTLAEQAAAVSVLFVESTAATRPLAGVVGRLHRATDTGAITYDTGSAWQAINPGLDFGEVGDITASAPGDTSAAGGTGEVADAGHRHAREAARTRTNVQHIVSSPVGNYTVAADVSLVFASGTSTVTLPAANAHAGRQVDVKNTGSGTVTVASAGGQVEGAATASLPAAHSITAVSDGANWFVI